MEKKLNYTAVVIEDIGEIKKVEEIIGKSILQFVPHEVIDGTEWSYPSDYHMTVKLGILGLSRKMSSDINSEVDLEVIGIGANSEAVALLVTGYMSKNARQHITVAFKKSPSASNLIPEKNCHMFDNSYFVKGVIREI